MPEGVKAAEQAVPGGGAKPLPPAPSQGLGQGEVHVTPLSPGSREGPFAPTGAGTAGTQWTCHRVDRGCRPIPSPPGLAGGELDAPTGPSPSGYTESPSATQPSLLPQFPPWGDGGSQVPFAFGCILTWGPSQPPHAVAGSLQGHRTTTLNPKSSRLILTPSSAHVLAGAWRPPRGKWEPAILPAPHTPCLPQTPDVSQALI